MLLLILYSIIFPITSKPRVWIMENESDSTVCGICGIYGHRLLILGAQERILVEKVFRCVALHPCSKSACDVCLGKLYIFKNFLKEIILNQAKLRHTHARKMQEGFGNNEDEEHRDSIDCRCSNCRSKFGSLPLLVQVIEENEEKTERNQDEPMPSTSHDASPQTDRKRMQCSHCEKKFSHKGDLNKHMRTHTGEQPFRCSICDRKFAHTSNLARHMRLHSGDKPFTCETCNKNFSRKDKLELHRRNVNCKKTS